MKTEILRTRIEPKLKQWVKQQGNSSNYLRTLIQKDKNKKEKLLPKKELEIKEGDFICYAVGFSYLAVQKVYKDEFNNVYINENLNKRYIYIQSKQYNWDSRLIKEGSLRLFNPEIEKDIIDCTYFLDFEYLKESKESYIESFKLKYGTTNYEKYKHLLKENI